MLSHKEMTAHIRNRIKVAGIKSRVKMQSGNDGNRVIMVVVPSYGVEFSTDEQRSIRHIAKCNHLTWVRGLPIDVDQMTDPEQMDFYYTPGGIN